MSLALIDTSFVLADALGQRPRGSVRDKMGEFDVTFASRFLEAEFLSACRREAAAPASDLLAPLKWVDVERSLVPEITRVLDAGYVRGGDCWHLATALYVSPDPRELTFLTLDIRQRTVAKALGFRV